MAYSAPLSGFNTLQKPIYQHTHDQTWFSETLGTLHGAMNYMLSRHSKYAL